MIPIRIAVLGAAGRLGSAIVRCALQAPDIELVAAFVSSASPNLGKDVPETKQRYQLAAEVTACDVLIDTAGARGFDDLMKCCDRSSCALVSASTGLTETQSNQLAAMGMNRAILRSANLSVGIAVLRRALRQTAVLLGPGWECEISETHHRHKRDSPSGTALLLARDVQSVRSPGLQAGAVVPIHALRGGDVIGDHTIDFLGDGERIALSHVATSRDIYANGALRAARFIVRQPPGLKSMDDLLDF